MELVVLHLIEELRKVFVHCAQGRFPGGTDVGTLAHNCELLTRCIENPAFDVQGMDRAQLRRQLLALANAVGGLTAVTAVGTAVGPSLLQAGCHALTVCTHVARDLHLPSNESVRVAGACRLLLESGAAMLRAVVSDAGVLADVPGSKSASTQVLTMASVIHNLLRSGGAPLAAAHMAAAEAAFAAGVGKPADLLPWLDAVTAALLVSCEQRSEVVGPQTLFCYTLLLKAVVRDPPFASHARELAAQPQLTAAAVQLLLRHALPALASIASADVLLDRGVESADRFGAWLPSLAEVLAAPGIQAAVVSSMRQPGSVAVVQHAAQLVHALPVLPPDGVQPARLAARQRAAVTLLARAAYSMIPIEARLADATSSGSSSTGSNTDGSMAGVSADGSSGSGSDATEAGRARKQDLLQASCTMVEVVPHVAAVIEAQAAAEGGIDVATLCQNLCTALHLADPCRFMAPPEVFASWLAAADAGVRLQPLLSQLDGSFRQLAAEHPLKSAAALLSSVLMCKLWRHVPPSLMMDGLDALPGLRPELVAAQAGLPAQLWQLHSSSCRLLHWLAADSSRQLAAARLEGLGMTADTWSYLLFGLHQVFYRAHDLMTLCTPEDEADVAGGGAQQGSSKIFPAMALSAAHAEAVQAAAPLAAGCEGRHITSHDLCTAASAMQSVAMSSPASVGPDFLAPIQHALAALPQGSFDAMNPSRRPQHAVLSQLVHAAADVGWLAAALASSGLLGEAVEAAAQLGEEEADRRQETLRACYEAMTALRQAAELVHTAVLAHTNSGRPGEALAVDAAEQLATAEGHLAALLDQPAADDAEHNGLGVEQLRQLLQPVADTAAKLHRVLALPFLAKSEAASVAKGAATRSCAYLRCSNVALQGGPAAKQGQGCKRCGGCKSAYYCSTACSHADWHSLRHKGACKELAAARAADVAAAVAAATV